MYYKLSIESFSQKFLYNFYLSLFIYLNTKLYLNYKNKKKYFLFEPSLFFLQKNKKKYTLNRSPHVNKKAREQFETRIYKAIIFLKIKNVIFLKKRELFFIFYFLKKFINNSLFSSLIRSRLILFKKDLRKYYCIKSFLNKKDVNHIIKNNIIHKIN